MIKQRQGKNDEAQKDFKKAVELDPSLKEKLEPLMNEQKARRHSAEGHHAAFTKVLCSACRALGFPDGRPGWSGQAEEPLKRA